MRRCPPLFGLTMLVMAAPGAAAAKGERAACVAADQSASRLVADHKLVEAREQLQVCTAPECPAAQRKDCQKLTTQVDAAMPTVVFSAADAAGKPLKAVKVTVDGRRLADRLDGTALAVDPGDHSFTFTAEGLPPVTKTLTMNEGDKARQETVTLAPAAAAVPEPESPPPEAPRPAPTPAVTGDADVLGIVTGGLGFAGMTGIAVGGIFGLLTIEARNREVADCASPTSCKDHGQATSERAAAQSNATISTVGFVAGGLLLAGAAVYYFVAGQHRDEPPPATGLLVAPSIGPGGAGISVQGDL